MTPLSSLNPRDVAAIDLGRILSRLEQKILSADTADTRLQHSSYERTRTSAVILPYPSLPLPYHGHAKLTVSNHSRISNTPALCSSASSTPLPPPSNSHPKKPRPNPLSLRNAPSSNASQTDCTISTLTATMTTCSTGPRTTRTYLAKMGLLPFQQYKNQNPKSHLYVR